MSTEARTTETSQQTDGAPGAALPPGTPPAGKEPQTPPAREGARQEAREGRQQPPPAPPSAKLLGDEDDDEVDDRSPYQITGAALKKRLGRFSSKELRRHFGTDDPEQIKTRLKKLEELETKAEEDRRAKLDEQERLKEDVRRATERAEAAETRARQVEEERVVDQQESRLQTIAAKFVDPDYIDDVALPKLARHLRKLPEKEVESLTDADLEKWFKDLVEKKPKIGKEQAQAAPPPPPKKQGLTSTPRDDRPSPNPSGGGGEKTFKPGQPNSYTKEEMVRMGYRY